MSAVVSRRRSASAKPSTIGSSLACDPACGVVVPLVSAAGDRSDGGVDQIPAVLVSERAHDRPPHESAPATLSGDGIDPIDELVIELYVHTHV